MRDRTVLISGASIAGPALAFWLKRQGWRPVIIERARELRLGGQNIDIRGAGREVVRRMGIEDAIRAATTGEKGVRFVGRNNVTKAEFPAGTSESGGATAEVEILRGDLARLLHDRTRDMVEYVFGDHITSLQDGDTQITASFAQGADRKFDLVIAADGLRSATRGLVFGHEPRIRRIGLSMAYFTIPRGPSDTAWARWYNAPGGRMVAVRPDNVGTTRALLSFLSEEKGYETLSAAEQKRLLVTTFADAGWETPRILAGLEGATDMYFESIGQVHAKSWSRGRFALVGDAAYCPSPISGMGTTLALVGAYVLAGELGMHADHRDAFASYERLMRPYVEEAQNLPRGTPWVSHPRTKAGITLLNTFLAVAGSPWVRALGYSLFSPPADKLQLPDYSAPTRRLPLAGRRAPASSVGASQR